RLPRRDDGARRVGPPCAGCGRSASPRPSTAAARGEPAVRNGAARERGRRRKAYEAPTGAVAPGPRVQRRRIEAETVPPLPCTAVSGHAPSTAREQGRIRSTSLAVVGEVQGRGVALSGGRSRQLAARRLYHASRGYEQDVPGCQAGCSHHHVADRVAQTCERVGVRLPRLGNDSDVLGSALGIDDPEGDHAPLAYTGDRVGGVLDVVRRVLHAADHDHVLAPSDEEEIRSGKVGTISRVDPPVDERLSGPRWI